MRRAITVDSRQLGIGQRLAFGFGVALVAILALAAFAVGCVLFAFDGADAHTRETAQELAYAIAGAGLGGLALVLAVAWLSVRSIALPLGQAAAAARAAAEGDFTAQLAPTGRGETAELLAALRAMAERLAQVVARARESTASIDSRSRQVAAGARTLASRAEDEASALVEAASTLEEFTAALQKNAEHAGNASRLAAETAKIAENGNHVVARVVGTMDGISASSRRIADIVSVIDSIAFQTNILALNAAVEAARAGEEGRGFAVVASEVRSLAQRSGESAREIRTLIADSLERMQAGTTEARAAGEAMDDILTSINIVAQVVSEIADAVREQSAGISQINEAVSRLDAATHANASLAGETTAAAEGMRADASALSETLAGFRVAEPAGLQAPARLATGQ